MLKERTSRPKRRVTRVQPKHAGAIFAELKKLHPDAHIELNFSNPLELLIATILSAQCTDKKVNEVTKILFSRCPTAESYLELSESELEAIIRPSGFFRQKGKSIRGAVKTIVEEHGGKVPKTMDELVKLPGVGRKTANVVLGNAFNVPGLPVDTHVIRISNRLGLTEQSDPEKIERELQLEFPEKEWTLLSHTLIFHGRRVCFARKPKCESCPVRKYCTYFREQAGG